MSQTIPTFIANKFKIIELHGITPELACTCQAGAACKTKGKHPVRKGRDPIALESIKEGFNVGILCGIDGLVVIDIDERNGGLTSLANLKQAFGELPPTLTVTTGSGGKHFYYRCKKNIRSFKPALFPGIDVQASGAYVVAPPSIHASGVSYQWDDSEQEIAELPQFIIDLIPATNVKKLKQAEKEPEAYDKEEVIEALQHIDPSCSYDLWWKIAAALYNSGIDFDVFDKWSQGSKSKYCPDATKLKWDSFSKSPPTSVSCGTVIYNASLNGWKKKSEVDSISFSDPIAAEIQEPSLLDELNVVVDYPKGDTGRLASWIYENALYKNKNYAIQAALSTVTAIAQGLHRTSYMNGKLSSIALLVADAGSGKLHYTERVSDIINAVDKGLRLGYLQSKQALHSNLYKCNNRVIIQSESLSFFSKISNEKNYFMNQITESFLTCWDSSNWMDELVTKKESNSIGGIPEAHLTMIGGGVTSDLEQLINNPMFAESGLLSRLDFIIESHFEKNPHKEVKPDFTPEIKNIVEKLKHIRKLADTSKHDSCNLNLEANEADVVRHFKKLYEVKIGDSFNRWQEMSKYFLDLKAPLADLIPASRLNVIGGLLHRVSEKMLRLACVLSAMDRWNIVDKKLDPEHLEWAFRWYKMQFYSLLQFVGGNLSATNSNDLTEYLYKVCLEFKDKTGKRTFRYSELYQRKRKTLRKYSRREVDDALSNLAIRLGVGIEKKKNGIEISMP